MTHVTEDKRWRPGLEAAKQVVQGPAGHQNLYPVPGDLLCLLGGLHPYQLEVLGPIPVPLWTSASPEKRARQ